MATIEGQTTKAGTFSYTAPDGGQITVTSERNCSPHTGVVAFQTPWGLREFTSGNRDFGRLSAGIDFEIFAFEETYGLGVGTVLLAHASPIGYESDVYVGVWEGQRYSTWVSLARPDVQSNEDVLRLLSLFEYTESPSGLEISSASKEVGQVDDARNAPAILVPVLDVGLLRVRQATDNVKASLPPWEGLKVSGGELFAATADSFIILGTSAVTWLYAEGHDVSDDDLATYVGSLTTDWRVAI